jgi:hypothetical protein
VLRGKLIAISAVFAIACGAGHPTGESQEPRNRSDSRSDASDFAKASSDKRVALTDRQWVGFYGGPEEPIEFTSEEQFLWNSAREDGYAGCVSDSGLVRAAREYAESVVAATIPQGDGDLDRLRFSLLRSGVADYSVHLLTARADEGGLESLVKLIGKRKASWTHCGAGIAGQGPTARAVWIGVDRQVALDPFPTAVSFGAEILVSGRVLVASDSPIQSFIGFSDGAVERLPDQRLQQDGRFQFEISFGRAGRSEFELVVDAGRGPETAILVPVFVDVPPDPRPIIALDSQSEGGAKSPAEDLLDYLEAARSRLGLHPLVPDERLTRVASDHSRDMARYGFFGHISPYRGSLAKRLDSEGLTPARSAENVARSSTAFRIHLNLMRSPSHRINLLDPDFTHVGIGVAEDNGDLIATEIFARW